ncbi:MAG: TonB-dependent receptor plug domain-containing protein [Nitrospirales bacterium]
MHHALAQLAPRGVILIFPLFLGPLSLLPNFLNAADDSSISELDPVVVTASAGPTALARTPASVAVISRDQIDRQEANRLSTVLQQIPGLYVDEMGGRGGISSVYIRGGDPNFTVIMIDGIRLNDPTNQRGGSVDLSTLTTERIDRIEIVRGPASALYGSDAMGGVINIITRRGQSKGKHRLQVEGGQFGYTRGFLQASGPLESLTYTSSISYTRNDAQVDGDKFDLATVSGRLEWPQGTPLTVQLTGQYTKSDVRSFPEGSGGPRLAILRDTEQRNTDEAALGILVTQNGDGEGTHQFSATLFHRSQDVENPGVLSAPDTFQIPPATFTTNFTQFRLLWKHLRTLSKEWSLAGGLQLNREHGERTGVQQLSALGKSSDQRSDFQKTRTTPAGFVEASFFPLPNVTVTSGIRLDVPEEFPVQVSPRAALIVHFPSETTLRGSYGEGFKLPSFNALGDPLIGSSALEAESSVGWDAGIRQELNQGKYGIEMTYFYNRFSDLIDLDPNLARQGTFKLINLNTVVTQGIELSLDARPLPSLHLKGYFTYLDSDIRGTSGQLRNRPRYSGGFVIDAQPIPSLKIRGNVRAVGERFDLQIPTDQQSVPGYIKADLAATLYFWKSWKLFGVVENVTNTTYEEFLGFGTPKAWFRFGLEYTS